MIIGRNRFNIYFGLVALVALLPACKTSGEKKVVATFRAHIEVVPESMDFSKRVPIFRAKPVMVTVDKEPFLTEANVTGAKVVENRGGFDLQIQVDRQGSWLLEEKTTSNPGMHIAVFSAFEDRKNKKKDARWLGAPLITHRVGDGILTFAPDATREEAELIAQGLNNYAAKNKQSSEKW